MNWNQRYKNKDTPWDHGEAPKELLALLKHTNFWKNKRVLVAGCGRGYDARAIGKIASEVIGMDLSDLAVEEAKEKTIQENVYFLRDDFFEPIQNLGKFDVIFENTFFCAIDPDIREDYVQRASEVLNPEGYLIGLFYIEAEDGLNGPPWATGKATVRRLFSKYFEEQRMEMPLPFRSHKTPICFRKNKEVN